MTTTNTISNLVTLGQVFNLTRVTPLNVFFKINVTQQSH